MWNYTCAGRDIADVSCEQNYCYRENKAATRARKTFGFAQKNSLPDE